jgi:DNA-binding beta-propeller fold protein YncE
VIVRITHALGAVVAATALTAFLGAPAVTASTTTPTPTSAHAADAGSAVFVQSNDPEGNTVVAYERLWDGTLDQQKVYKTGGLGGVLEGAELDHLASQGSLTYDDQAGLLYAVNAGSDTLTMFAVHGTTLERLQTVPTSGDFPVSVTVHDEKVWVLNALGGGSIQGFVRAGDELKTDASWHRSLGLDPDATEFTQTPGQISFSPDGSLLIVTTKAGGNTIDVFTMDQLGTPAVEPVVTETPDAVPFGFTFDAAGRLHVTEAGPNTVETFEVNVDGTLTSLGQTPTGQMATCWIVAEGSNLYATNTGSDTVTSLSVDSMGMTMANGETPTSAGPIDAAVSPDGQYLYVQTGGDGTVDEFLITPQGEVSYLGAVKVPGGVGGEGIVAT